MSAYVIDTSIAVQWFFEEEYTNIARELVTGSEQLHAPELLLLEFDSVLRKRVRRKQITNIIASDFHLAIRKTAIEMHELSELLDLSWEIAQTGNCTVYDSVFVALAVLLKIQIVTADRRLCNGLRDSPWKTHAKWIGDFA